MTASHVTSPLVERLRHAIQHDSDAEQRAMHTAELACYWARVGEFELADDVREMLRRDFGRGDNIRLTVLIMCVEALLGYFRNLSAESRDRLVRAKLLSSLARDKRLIALTTAWLAHIEFNQNRFNEMTATIRDCLSAIEPSDVAAQCRVSLVLGDAFLYCKQREFSQAWYFRAHAAAADSGDHAAIGALTYNRAALNVANARLAAISLSLHAEDLTLLRGEVNSAINYQRIARLKSLDHLLSAAEVGVCLLQGQFTSVVQVANQALESGQVSKDSAEGLLLRADKAVGLANMELVKEADEVVAELESVDLNAIAADDRALALHSIRSASELCGRLERLNEYTEQINSAIETHNASIARLRRLLGQFDPNLSQELWRPRSAGHGSASSTAKH